MYTTSAIANIIQGQLIADAGVTVAHLVYDSRRLQEPSTSLFFALETVHADGHNYIQEAYQKGVRAFVVNRPIALDEAAVLLVPNTLKALQTLAIYHRQQFSLPVIGITGSNGKTVVKEWLNTLLEDDFQIVRSPKSFNSQIGVPLSVWEINSHHTLGIFEAGISAAGEMDSLQEIIQPSIGVLTTIGEAHSEGFVSDDEKLQEKLKLFKEAEISIGEAGLLHSVSNKKFTWSFNGTANLKIKNVGRHKNEAVIEAESDGKVHRLVIPFTDAASIQNAITCWCVLLYLKVDQATIQQRFLKLHTVDMRLQLAHGINNCLLINDSYSADPTSLKIALDFLVQQGAKLCRTVILSDFFESGKTDEELYGEIAQLLHQYKIQRLIAIGEKIGGELKTKLSSIGLETYHTTNDFIQAFKSSGFNKEVVLIKGARKFAFEKIARLFEQKLHGTVLQINLTSLVHNLKKYQKLLKPTTKIMAMVKAFAYGSGGAEIASVLQFHNVAFLGVAYADEGVELVRSGITIPIMVMNAEVSSFASIVENSLQPVMYSMALLQSFESYVKDQGLLHYPVHLEVETGMNRLGFALQEVKELAIHFAASSYLQIKSVFSHLAASESASEDAYTSAQAAKLNEAVQLFQSTISYSFLSHISNSAAIVRHPALQMDMVRLGIGLYGIEPDAENRLNLQPVATLRSTIAQIKELKKGESVSYNRRGVVQRNSCIATVRIGYADGYSRQFGNGVGKMMVHGREAPVIGTVCMDMTMIDVTDIALAKEGDDVQVFGPALPVQQVAALIGTIPYEIMTSVSQRVKRVYYYE